MDEDGADADGIDEDGADANGTEVWDEGASSSVGVLVSGAGVPGDGVEGAAGVSIVVLVVAGTRPAGVLTVRRCGWRLW
ncbi:hypothetical protein M1L58_16915 [Gordonia sp. C13]|nr:hypothetical protein [Gordonia sp. C13]